MSMYHRKEVPVALDLDSGEATTRGPTYQEAKMMHTREACKDNQSVWNKAKNEYLLHRHIRIHEESKTTESLVTTVLLVLSVAAVSRAAVNWCTCVSESGAVATTRMNHADSLKSYKINTDNKLVKMFEERGRKYGFTDIDVDDMCSVYYVPPGAEMPPDGKGTGDNSPLINGILGNLRAAVVEERPEDYREWHKQHARKYEQWRERPEAMDQHLEAHPLEDVYERASPKHAAEAFHTAMQAYPASVIVIGNKTVVISTQGDRLVVSDHLTDNSARHTEVHNGKTWSSDGKHTPWWISKEFIKDMEDQLLVYSTKEKKEQLTANELRMRDLYERLLSEERKFASEDEMQKAKDMAEVMKKEGDEVNSSSIISPFLSGIKGFGHLNLNPRVGAEISISI